MLAMLLMAGSNVHADRPPNPFLVTGAVVQAASKPMIRFGFTVPQDHIIYADRLKFQTAEGDDLEPANIPAPVTFTDPVTGKEKKGYTNSFAAEIALTNQLPCQMLIKFQGCSNAACYFPEKKLFDITERGVASASRTASTPETMAAASMDLQVELGRFDISARETGYLKSGAFLTFLAKANSGGAKPDDPLETFKRMGLIATLGLILVGGAGLNLTPCVLPMIPLNLALMGATTKGRSRKRGFALGGSYAAGMALAYGVLGGAVVLTGAKFGALNSSMWFNVGIAAIFVGLALAMFDVFHIDFTKYQNSVDTTRVTQRGQMPFAFLLGAMTALLAGACVAPVVITVLLLSAQMYVEGQMAGLLLPLVLGLGMASPWPFAGAGLAYLPKPGKWMVWVKRVFGIVILGMAFYYGHLAWNLAKARTQSSALASAPGGHAGVSAASNDALFQALERSKLEGRPVFIDFWASWCKNCMAMDETVFKASEVQKRLQDFIVVKYQAEQPNEAPAKDVLDKFGVLGLPTYVVLTPKKP